MTFYDGTTLVLVDIFYHQSIVKRDQMLMLISLFFFATDFPILSSDFLERAIFFQGQHFVWIHNSEMIKQKFVL